MSSPVGTLLNDRYRLDARVGAGGMSTVFRAFDTVLERQVAIKMMHREIARDSDQLERFRREARAVAQLNHPHIVGVIDANESDDTPYIVFEYVEGETLKDRIRRRGRLPVNEAIAYAIEIARALGAAHERAIVHRDVKPQNVLVDEEGSAKVTDFGIARTLDQEGLTADGRVLGTTDYVSPEQALGHAVTGQSDLYSLGVVLYEMLTGDVPFKGENPVAVAMKHVREEVPDIQLQRPGVSNALAAVLEHATAKDIARRYPDAGTMITDLEDVLVIETTRSGQATGEATAVLRTLPPNTARRVPTRIRHPIRILLVLALVAAVVIGAAVLLGDRTERGTRQRAVTPTPPGIEAVSLAQSRANDFDPFSGDKEEHPDEVRAVLDDDPGTAWSTETYQGGTLNNKPGVGIYVDARPTVAAKRMDIITPTPGWKGKVYVAKSGPPDGLEGWTELADVDADRRKVSIDLDTAGNAFRYYLVWITDLPPDGDKVEVSEIVLLQVSPREVRLTRPDRVLWPDDGITKADLAAYFRAIAPVMLPHVRDRPVSLQRFREGIDHGGFFQKDLPQGAPDWVRTAEVPKKGGVNHHVLANDADTLVWFAQLNAITPHVFTSRADRLERPDRLVIDLDPSTEDFGAVRAAALRTGDALRAHGLEPFAMVTGSRGVHVVVPLKRTRDAPDVLAWSRAFADALAEADADALTTEFHKAKRGDRIYLDVARNGPAQTVVPPYAPRPRPGAPVATPLRWEELDDADLRPDGWTLRTVGERLDALGGDPWAGIAKAAKALPRF